MNSMLESSATSTICDFVTKSAFDLDQEEGKRTFKLGKYCTHSHSSSCSGLVLCRLRLVMQDAALLKLLTSKRRLLTPSSLKVWGLPTTLMSRIS